jgi:hypothetical protein
VSRSGLLIFGMPLIMRRYYKNASDDSHNTCVMKFSERYMGLRFRERPLGAL